MKKTNVKITYIGGGSRGWAKAFMIDLAKEDSFTASIYLYDIDNDASKMNQSIGNDLALRDDVVGKHKYIAVSSLKEALTGADFVVMSILPGTFEEMRSDVHAPEKYGIYQPVGDSTGPGGIVRAMRTIPIYAEYAKAIGEYCPNAWVINYTNPMTMCTRTLYKANPSIKAFGCCHEVFTTQRILAHILNEKYGIKANRAEIAVDVAGVNHFTWVSSARYQNIDLMPLYKDFVQKNYLEGFDLDESEHRINSAFKTSNKVKFDLFKRYGVIAAAGDRHLAEFCPRTWYLDSPKQVEEWKFALTDVDYRLKDLSERLISAEKLYKREEVLKLSDTGEEGVQQVKAILGLQELVTNVNLPNRGQMAQLPKDVVVETNAVFRSGRVIPVVADELPEEVISLISRISREQEVVVDACVNFDYERVFEAFVNDPLVSLPLDKAKALFTEMVENTKQYIPHADEFLAKF